VLLPDEPLSAPDAKIRLSLRSEIRAIQRALGITTLFVTDDQEEALSMSDRVVVMQDGRAEQIGTPAEVYNTPATRCVAGFIGTLNLLDARVTDPAQGLVDAGGHSLSLGRPLDVARNAEVTPAIRPQAIDLAAPGAERAAALDICLPAMVRSIEFPGTIIRLAVTAGPARLPVDLFNRDAGDSPPVGSEVVLLVQGADVVLLAS
jgi:putative spermidine/putrescine transport system ATP-binding protein